jgi:heme oxygenase
MRALARADIMSRLRSETREEHAATEETALARAMLKGEMTLGEYESQLVAYHLVHESIDRCLGRSAFASSIAGTSRKTSRLAADLAALGATADICGRESEAAARALVALAEEADPAGLLGIVYVMEGSSLGAALLGPRIREALALPPEACTYYAGDGSMTLARWKAFGARMDAGLVDAADQERALTAARATFTAIRRLFDALRPSAPEASP